MLFRGVRIALAAAATLVALAVVLHFVLVLSRAPAEAQWDLVNTFVATFASVVFAFFVGILLFDYQVEATDARRTERLGSLLMAELSDSVAALADAAPVQMPLADGSVAEAVIAHVQPLAVEEAVRSGLFDPSHAEAALRLSKNMRAYSAGVSALLSFVSTGSTADPGSEKMVLHIARNVEQARRAVVEGCESLIRYR